MQIFKDLSKIKWRLKGKATCDRLRAQELKGLISCPWACSGTRCCATGCHTEAGRTVCGWASKSPAGRVCLRLFVRESVRVMHTSPVCNLTPTQLHASVNQSGLKLKYLMWICFLLNISFHITLLSYIFSISLVSTLHWSYRPNVYTSGWCIECISEAKTSWPPPAV